ncbi:transposase [Rathayibacter sp. VKM Ac-2878]|nr:transposase [Rathayibacter sp. VKM Ac-2879]MBF4502696.1 transposase [Rathayibacter sp. VKM Ac-2878]
MGAQKAVAVALKPVYQAPTADAAKTALEAFTASELGARTRTRRRCSRAREEQFTPFLAFPPEVRRVIYTTNAIKSPNESDATSNPRGPRTYTHNLTGSFAVGQDTRKNAAAAAIVQPSSTTSLPMRSRCRGARAA